jgi:hypothetical protein
LAVILGKIAQQPSRLANAGLQLGLDGETLAGPNHISFEGKLYAGRIKKNEVLTKTATIIRQRARHADYVLLCPCQGVDPAAIGDGCRRSAALPEIRKKLINVSGEFGLRSPSHIQRNFQRCRIFVPN